MADFIVSLLITTLRYSSNLNIEEYDVMTHFESLLFSLRKIPWMFNTPRNEKPK